MDPQERRLEYSEGIAPRQQLFTYQGFRIRRKYSGEDFDIAVVLKVVSSGYFAASSQQTRLLWGF